MSNTKTYLLFTALLLSPTLAKSADKPEAVSYTHLTLPTIYSV